MKVELIPAQDGGGAPEAAALQQSRPYALAALAVGAKVERVVVHEGGTVLAQALVLRRRGVRLVLRGPVWAEGLTPTGKRRALRRLARQGAAVLATPEAPLAGFGLVPLITGRSCALWSLEPEPHDLRAAAGAKWRNRVVTAARQGVEIRPAGAAALELLVAAEAAQRVARGYHALPAAFSLALPPEDLRLWHWHEGGGLHAAMCFVRHGAWATYHLGWADARARAAGVHGLMLWQAALALRAEGVRMLDLGDVNTTHAPGLARFKLGTGAALHRLGATCLVLPG